MLVNKWFKLSKYKQVFVIIISGLFVSPVQAQQQNFDAGFVLNEMTSDQQVSYIAGIIEGLAFSRWLKDGKIMDGMNCIYDWYYENSLEKWKQIEAFFGEHPARQPGPLVYILVRAECGE